MAPNAVCDITLSIDEFGTFIDPITKNHEAIKRFTWTNKTANILVQVISYGATITRIKVPDRYGFTEDIVLGYDNMEGYLDKQNPYFGATVGRVCNRINKGQFHIDGELVQVSKNWNNRHTLHGGFIAVDKRNWIPYVDGLKLVLTHVSEDNSEGFPGIVMAVATFELLNDNSFRVLYNATTTKKTPINLTNHSYFNLAGHAAGYPELYKHIVSLNADKMTETDEDSIPSGRLLNIGGTLYDLRIPTELGPIMTRLSSLGYDDNFCVTQGSEQSLTFIARALHPETGRFMEVYSDQPGVQFYTSNHMPDPLGIITPSHVNAQYFYNDESGGIASNSQMRTNATKSDGMVELTLPEPPIIGKNGAKYYKHGAFCFETQKYPDSVNHENFPSSLLNPGETYKHEVIYKFGVQAS